MSSPRIIISGDFLRPGQDGNIAFLWAALRDRVTATFGVEPELVGGRPLAWDEWRHARVEGTFQYLQAWGEADLVIGFELSPAARAAAPRWIDIRRHPFRFDSRQPAWSVTASFVAQLESTPLELNVPRVKATPGAHRDAAIMLQVQSDSAMLEGTELLMPDKLAPEFAQLAGDKAGVWIVPHPNEPRNAWLDAVQAAIPRARIWQGNAYEAMASVSWMFTVSSSTGFEAPCFNCAPTFLRKPEEPSAPFDLGKLSLWAELAAHFTREAVIET